MNKLKALIPIIISIICLYLALSGVSFSSVASSFSKIKWHWIFLSFFLSILGFIIRVIRWGFFFKIKLRFYSLISSFLIGLMVNNILPARIGELVRAYILGGKENISKSLVFGTVLLERTFDGLSVFLFLAILLFVCPFPENVKTMGFILTGIYLIVLVFFFVLKINKGFVVKRLAFSKRLSSIVSEFSEGLVILGSLRHTIIISFYSIFAWVIAGFFFYFCLLGFSLDLPIYVSFFILVMAVIGVMIPAAPGYLGTYQYFSILALTIFGVDKDIAFSYSIVSYIVSFFPVTIAGIILLFKEGLSFGKIISLRKP